MGGLPEEGLGRTGMKIHAKVLIHKANDFLFVKVSELKNIYMHLLSDQ